MALDCFDGSWVCDSENSRLNSPPPACWVQHIHTRDGRIRVKEEITNAAGVTTFEVDAVPDGQFYPVIGSAVADEMSYRVEDEKIIGVGRKAGSVSIWESLSCTGDGTMAMHLSVLLNGTIVQLGVAQFRKK